MDYLQIRKKLKIEALWNQLVYKKYFKNIKINKKLMRQTIIKEFKN